MEVNNLFLVIEEQDYHLFIPMCSNKILVECSLIVFLCIFWEEDDKQ